MKNYTVEESKISRRARRIVTEGVVVVDNITEMPIYGEPFISNNYVFGINHQGYIDVEYNMRSERYGRHDIAIVYPHQIIFAKKASEDYRITLVLVSADLFQELCSHITFRNRFRYEQKPSFHLDENQYNDILHILDAMRTVGRSGIASRKTLMVNLLDILLELTDFFRHQNSSEQDLAPQRISARFFDMIIAHYRQQHSVSFYADQLCLSPKYFSTVIKEETGHNAKYWINHYVVTKAKQMLRFRGDYNIQQIGQYLGFDDQASFSRIFKKTTGSSPLEYRRQYLKIAPMDF